MTDTLDRNIGFHKNPFSKFSAEEEEDFHNEIFYQPKFYSTLLEDLKSGTSRFILGQRGHGKSSIIHKLKTDLENDDVLTVIIDRFDDISISNNKIEILNLILNEFVTKYIVFVEKNKFILDKLNKEDKEILSLLVKLFFNPLTKTEFENKYNNVKNIKRKNSIKKIFNFLLKPTNSILNASVIVTSDLIFKSFNIPNISEIKYSDYIKEFELQDYSDISNNEKELLKSKRIIE